MNLLEMEHIFTLLGFFNLFKVKWGIKCTWLMSWHSLSCYIRWPLAAHRIPANNVRSKRSIWLMRVHKLVWTWVIKLNCRILLNVAVSCSYSLIKIERISLSTRSLRVINDCFSSHLLSILGPFLKVLGQRIRIGIHIHLFIQFFWHALNH
jgi:hypothetical protein